VFLRSMANAPTVVYPCPNSAKHALVPCMARLIRIIPVYV